MKKIIRNLAVLIIVSLNLTLVACGDNNSRDVVAMTENEDMVVIELYDESSDQEIVEDNMKILFGNIG